MEAQAYFKAQLLDHGCPRQRKLIAAVHPAVVAVAHSQEPNRTRRQPHVVAARVGGWLACLENRCNASSPSPCMP